MAPRTGLARSTTFSPSDTLTNTLLLKRATSAAPAMMMAAGTHAHAHATSPDLLALRRVLTLPTEERTPSLLASAVAALKRLPFFHEMDVDAVAALAKRVALRKLKAGTVLFEQGSEGETMFVVIDGAVQIRVRRAHRSTNASGADETSPTSEAAKTSSGSPRKPEWGHVTARATGSRLPLRVVSTPTEISRQAASTAADLQRRAAASEGATRGKWSRGVARAMQANASHDAADVAAHDAAVTTWHATIAELQNRNDAAELNAHVDGETRHQAGSSSDHGGIDDKKDDENNSLDMTYLTARRVAVASARAAFQEMTLQGMYGPKVATLQAGACFGEQAVLRKAPRASTVIADVHASVDDADDGPDAGPHTEVILVSKRVAMEAASRMKGSIFFLGDIGEKLVALMRRPTSSWTPSEELAVEEMLASLRFFGAFDADVLHAMCRRVTLREVPAGSVVCEEGEIGDELYVVLRGSLDVYSRVYTEEKRVSQSETFAASADPMADEVDVEDLDEAAEPTVRLSSFEEERERSVMSRQDEDGGEEKRVGAGADGGNENAGGDDVGDNGVWTSTTARYGARIGELVAGDCLGEAAVIAATEADAARIATAVSGSNGAVLVVLSRSSFEDCSADVRQRITKILSVALVKKMLLKPPELRTSEDTERLGVLMQGSSAFASNLNAEVRNKLCECATLLQLEAQDPVFLMGEPCDAFYVVLSGELNVRIWEKNASKQLTQCHHYLRRRKNHRAKLPSRMMGKIVSTLHAGQSFGEMAFTTGGRRNASIFAADDRVTLMMVIRSDFERLMSDVQVAELDKKLATLRRPLALDDMAKYPTRSLAKIAYSFTVEKMARGKHVLCEGDAASRMYIVRSGLLHKCVHISSAKGATLTKVAHIGEGESVGAYACLFRQKEPVSAIVSAVHAEMYACRPEDLITAYGSLEHGDRALERLKRAAAQRHAFDVARIEKLVGSSRIIDGITATSAASSEDDMFLDEEGGKARVAAIGGVRAWLTRQPGQSFRLRDAGSVLERDFAAKVAHTMSTTGGGPDSQDASRRSVRGRLQSSSSSSAGNRASSPTSPLIDVAAGDVEGRTPSRKMMSRLLQPDSSDSPPAWLRRGWLGLIPKEVVNSTTTMTLHSHQQQRRPLSSPMTVSPKRFTTRSTQKRGLIMITTPTSAARKQLEWGSPPSPSSPYPISFSMPPSPSSTRPVSPAMPPFLHTSSTQKLARPSTSETARIIGETWWTKDRRDELFPPTPPGSADTMLQSRPSWRG